VVSMSQDMLDQRKSRLFLYFSLHELIYGLVSFQFRSTGKFPKLAPKLDPLNFSLLSMSMGGAPIPTYDMFNTVTT